MIYPRLGHVINCLSDQELVHWGWRYSWLLPSNGAKQFKVGGNVRQGSAMLTGTAAVVVLVLLLCSTRLQRTMKLLSNVYGSRTGFSFVSLPPLLLLLPQLPLNSRANRWLCLFSLTCQSRNISGYTRYATLLCRAIERTHWLAEQWSYCISAGQSQFGLEREREWKQEMVWRRGRRPKNILPWTSEHPNWRFFTQSDVERNI